jgi:hypothetical protein
MEREKESTSRTGRTLSQYNCYEKKKEKGRQKDRMKRCRK